ncbi:MAG: hypothetical protein QW405_02840 [Fervidicoccaceae archaeon]
MHGDSSEPRLVVVTVRPRTFVAILSRLRELSLPYKIPESLPYECGSGEVVIYDDARAYRGPCKAVEARGPSETERAVISALLALRDKEAFDEVLVGVDVGEKRHAVAVLADGILLYSFKEEAARPAQRLAEALRGVPRSRLKINVGYKPAKSEAALSLSVEISKACGTSVALVDESSTSRALRLRAREGMDPDIVAARFIALREDYLESLG